jgi:hypothetical protein
VWSSKDEIKRFLRIREGAAYCDGSLAREMELRPSLVHSQTKKLFGEPMPYQRQLGTCVACQKVRLCTGFIPPGFRKAAQ